MSRMDTTFGDLVRQELARRYPNTDLRDGIEEHLDNSFYECVDCADTRPGATPAEFVESVVREVAGRIGGLGIVTTD